MVVDVRRARVVGDDSIVLAMLPVLSSQSSALLSMDGRIVDGRAKCGVQ